ncbi:hypothetical protein C1645_836021 [Glomus cerebriforme]|uniref:Uncharacterized protein n=1 Tax=Glomus cerebriforme TaxID=658196 RepID=A0A397S6M4_9GLOM|nr:hypothetical protein C1645_836021 [Glomus cerebriforme]
MFHFRLNNKKLKLNNYSVGKGLVIDRDIRIYQYCSSLPWRALFSSYSLSVLTPNILLYSRNKDGKENTEGRGGIDEVVVRGIDDVVMILGQDGDDVILGRGGINEVVVILDQGGVDEFLSVEGVEGVWPIEAKISAGTKSLKGSKVRDVLELDNDIDEDVNKDGLFHDVLGWDDINESRLFHGG